MGLLREARLKLEFPDQGRPEHRDDQDLTAVTDSAFSKLCQRGCGVTTLYSHKATDHCSVPCGHENIAAWHYSVVR